MNKKETAYRISDKDSLSDKYDRPSVDLNKNVTLLNVKYLECDLGFPTKASLHYLSEIEKALKISSEKFTLWPQIVAVLAAAFVHLGLGVIGGFTGIALPALTNPNSTDVYLNIDQASLFSSIPTIGYIVGSLITGFNLAWVGQRISLLMALPLGICGWIMLAISSNYSLLIFARFIMGIFGGAGITACGIYVVEIAHTTIRGRLLAIIDLMRQLGFVFVAIIGSTSLHWRYVGLTGGLISLIPPLLVLFFIPNSPRWLATKGRRKEAKKSLEFFRGKDYDVDKELGEVIIQLDENSAKKSSFLDQLKLLGSKKMRQRFIVLCMMMFLSHFTGNLVSVSYTITIFQSANTGIDEYISTVVATSMRIFGAATYIFIADKFGRKFLLIVPLSFTAIGMAVLGMYFYVMVNHNVQYISWVPLASIILYMYTTGIYYPVLMLLSSELLPTSVRSVGSSILFFLLTSGMFICLYTYPYMIESLGSHWTYWFYALNSFIILLLAVLFIPETKGKTLEQIGDMK